MHRALAATAVAGAFFWLLWGTPTRSLPQILSLQGATMGTSWNVQLVSADADPQAIAQAVQQLLDRLDRGVFSTWQDDSELSRLNRQPVGQPASVSPELFAVLQMAQQMHEASSGAFDISVGPLVDIWGFGPSTVSGVPSGPRIAEALARTGLQHLRLDAAARTATLQKSLSLDLSGIAKGYAVDAVAQLLQMRGHDDFLVEIGGELRLQGRRPDGEGWSVAVEAPLTDRREALVRLDSGGRALALAGSGDYRNFREQDGRRYSHEIDPRSGLPVSHELAAVTVIHGQAALADAWATALMVLGPEAGPQLADGEGVAAYFIMRTPAGFVPLHTRAFAPYLNQQQEGAR